MPEAKPSLGLQARALLLSLRGLPHAEVHQDWHAAALRFLTRVQDRHGTGAFPAGFHPKTGWTGPDDYTTARVAQRLLKVGEVARARRAADTLIRRDSGPIDPRIDGAALHLFLDLLLESPDDKRLQGTVKRFARKLVDGQDWDGTWSKGLNGIPPCAAAARTAWALERVARHDPSLPKVAHAAGQAIDWAVSKQKTNGYLYSCTWSIAPGVNPLLSELCEAAEGMLEVGILRDHRPYYGAALGTLRALQMTVPRGEIIPGAWTFEWNAERFVAPGATAEYARLLRRAMLVAPEEARPYMESDADGFQRAARRCQLHAEDLGIPELDGGVMGSLPMWGREDRWLVSCWATASLLG